MHISILQRLSYDNIMKAYASVQKQLENVQNHEVNCVSFGYYYEVCRSTGLMHSSAVKAFLAFSIRNGESGAET